MIQGLKNSTNTPLNSGETFTGREVLYFTEETDTNNATCGVRFSGILERVI